MSKKVNISITLNPGPADDFAERVSDRIKKFWKSQPRQDSPMPLWLDGRCIWCGDEAIADDCARKCASSKRAKATEKRQG